MDLQFDLPGPVQKISSLGSGHIHDTYLIECGDPANSRFVLQKFNHNVFRNPQQVASNIWLVLDHVLKTRSDQKQALNILKTKDDNLLYRSDYGEYWRVFNYISGSDSFEQVALPEQAFGAASAFGIFIKSLNGLDPKRLFTTIPDFHNLEVRFNQLKNAIAEDTVKRVSQYQKEVNFAADRQHRVAEYSMRVTKSGVPLRITHNDTKISNVLFKKGTTSAICVIDLDTVMPGLLLYDFGDMARTFCNSVLEDEDANQAEFRLDIFKGLCEGFFGGIDIQPSREEVETLKFGPWWMTYIMGIRFLTDFLSGDVYYKTSHPLQNLHRARNQFRLLSSIEEKQDAINEIITRAVASAYS